MSSEEDVKAEIDRLRAENEALKKPARAPQVPPRRGHSAYVRGVAVSPGGSLAASVSFDWELKVWDLKTGMALAAFTSDGPALCCAFPSEGMTLVGDATGQVHFLCLEFPFPN